jgi:hypothetical protein
MINDPRFSRLKSVLRKIVVTDMYEALSIHKIRQNTKMPTFYKTLPGDTIVENLEDDIDVLGKDPEHSD